MFVFAKYTKYTKKYINKQVTAAACIQDEEMDNKKLTRHSKTLIK